MTNPLIQFGSATATGANAIGIQVNGEATLRQEIARGATYDLDLTALSTTEIDNVDYDPAKVNLGSGATLRPLTGDRAVYDASGYALRHTNDTDDALASIHHTLGTGATQAATGDHLHPYATTAEIADVAAAESAGVSNLIPRGDHVHAHGSGYLPDAHHNQAHILGAGGDHSDAPANQADGFVKRNAANNAWEEVPYGETANTVAEGDHEHGTTGHQHGLMRWNGASGQTDFILSDNAEYLEDFKLNGLSEDPLNYTLQSDQFTVVLATALPTDMTAVAQYVVAQI